MSHQLQLDGLIVGYTGHEDRMSGFPPLLLSFLLGRGFLIAPSTLGTPPLRPPASLATIPGGFTLPSPTITTAALVALPLARWLIYSTRVRVSISHSGNMALSCYLYSSPHARCSSLRWDWTLTSPLTQERLLGMYPVAFMVRDSCVCYASLALYPCPFQTWH